MLYSCAGILSLIIHLIINHDVLLGDTARKRIPVHRFYRRYLLVETAYYVTDILWGVR